MVTSEKEPKVSVIIPVYNVKQYVAEALDSVISQTYKNLEIIIIDDGSNDGSEIICEEYAKKDDRIKLIHQQNRGLSAARNTGLDNMSGEYVAFLDSDDVFLPETIKKTLNIILSHDVDLVDFQYTTCKTAKNGKIKKPLFAESNPYAYEGIYSQKEAFKLVAENNVSVTAWNKLTKRKIWDNVRFPEGHVYEDLYIIFQVINKVKNIYLIKEPLILYRIRLGSINDDNSIKNIKDLLDSWAVFENFVKTNTPGLFDEEQITNTNIKILIYFVFRYIKFLNLQFPKKTEVMNLMKDKINQLWKNVKQKNCKWEIRFLYYMIFNHQRILSIFFQPGYLIYRLVKMSCRMIIK